MFYGEQVKKELGDTYPVAGWVEGCFAEAADLMGVNEFLMEVMDDDGYADALGRRYLELSEKSRKIVDGVIDGLLDMETDAVSVYVPEKIEYIKEYITPAAAGYASPAEGEDYTLVVRDSSVPAAADFAVRIAGDSMEPYIADGSRVYVSRDIELKDGDVGIFFVDGDMKCKQYCEDNFGNIYLFSLNRKRRDADVSVPADSGVTVFCFGRVILPKRPPLPGGN